MNPYQNLVKDLALRISEAKQYPLGTFPDLIRPPRQANAPKVLIFSPHPDDEVIIGGLALRLMIESGWEVINVAVTQGSNRERQAGRYQELQNCCRFIGFGLVQTAPAGLEKVSPKTRELEPGLWRASVKVIARLLAEHRPTAILFPHDLDWNSTHVGTHWLVIDALKTLPLDFSCHTVETEFWGQNPSPNLMVQLSEQHLGELMTALTFHIGEVKRNPYHLSLPAWMMDNVRRGAELVGGQGGAAPDYPFATLYRLRKWQQGQLTVLFSGGKQLTLKENPATLFD